MRSLKLVIWWNSACRSIMPVIRELKKNEGVEVKVVVLEKLSATRKALTWCEWEDESIVQLKESGRKKHVVEILKEAKSSIHLFGGYQRNSVFRYGISKAHKYGCFVGIMSESPLNMNFGFAGLVKAAYLNWVLPITSRGIIKKSKFIMNLSGKHYLPLIMQGWPPRKIHPYGYFPDARSIVRGGVGERSAALKLLSMGFLSRYKGNHILLEAIADLSRRGYRVECHIIGDGPERVKLGKLVEDFGLLDQITFHGVVSDQKLDMYMDQADVLVCPGLAEPWGMRVNEAILSGLIVVCSDGLGAAQLLTSGGIGSTFNAGDWMQLADVLQKYIVEESDIKVQKEQSLEFGRRIMPSVAARYLLEVVEYEAGFSEARPITPW